LSPWDEDERIEIISGEAYMTSPPSRIHQKISGGIFRQLVNFLEGKQCDVYAAPFGVRLFEHDNDKPDDVDTMVEPDISVKCDKHKLDKYGCKGAPGLIVEILSPSTQRHDQLVKLNLYERAGVREYWIVDPESKTVRVMLQASNGAMRTHEAYNKEDIAKVNVLHRIKQSVS